MARRKKIAIIGGGVSGLAAAKAFDERGHRVVGFERSHDFGGVWELSRSYPDVQTQSPKDLYCYTDHPMPESYPEWPKGPQVHAYLHSYAEKHRLARLFQLNTNVVSIHQHKEGDGWLINLEAAGKPRTEHVDFVVVATGQFSDKNVVEFDGQQAYTDNGGVVIHSSEYQNTGQIVGKRVVVLGGSKSATDVAVHAANHGATQVTMVYRENVWRVPYFVGGINFKRLLYMRAQEQQFNSWGRGPLASTLAALFKPLIWANFRGLETLLKIQLGLNRWNMVPDTPIEKAVSCSLPIVTPGLFEAFKAGTVVPIQSTISHYEQGRVSLESGESIDADVIILATGWKLGVPYLGEQDRARLIEPDGQYRVYRLAVNPDLPNLGFVGFNSSFCTVLSAELIANWLVRFADGKLLNQPDQAAMTANIEKMLDWRRNQRPAAQVYGGLCSAPFHFRHFDELLADMGCEKKSRSNPLAEQFSYPNAEAYGSYLASAPQYTVE